MRHFYEFLQNNSVNGFLRSLDIAPWSAKWLQKLAPEQDRAGKFFAKAASDILQLRMKDPKLERQDFLGLLVKAIREVTSRSNISIFENYYHKLVLQLRNNPEMLRLNVTPKLLENQIQLFLLAGFDTIRTTMSTTSYLLALHPEKQKRVIQEVG